MGVFFNGFSRFLNFLFCSSSSKNVILMCFVKFLLLPLLSSRPSKHASGIQKLVAPINQKTLLRYFCSLTVFTPNFYSKFGIILATSRKPKHKLRALLIRISHYYKITQMLSNKFEKNQFIRILKRFLIFNFFQISMI